MSALPLLYMAETAPPKPTTLYALSEELITFLDTIEMTEEGSPERAECEAAIALYMEQLPRKVDSVNWMLVHLEGQVATAAAEVKRLQARKQSLERSLERLEGYCVKILEKMPKPAKGKVKLEGSTVTFSLRPSERAIITDEIKVPVEYKTACLEISEHAWQTLVALYPQILGTVTKHEIKVRLADVKAALKAEQQIEGADIEYPNHLVRK